MIVTFKQDGAEDLVWPTFKPDRLMTTEAEAVEKVTGLTFVEWSSALLKGSATSSRALVWVLRKRTEPTLRFRDVDFPVGDLVLDFDPEEKTALRAELERNQDLTDEERAQVLAALGPAEDDEPPAGDGPGNDPEEIGSAPVSG